MWVAGAFCRSFCLSALNHETHCSKSAQKSMITADREFLEKQRVSWFSEGGPATPAVGAGEGAIKETAR